MRLKRGVYIKISEEIQLWELSNLIFKGSYISLDNILYKYWFIKQFNKSAYSVSNSVKSEVINFIQYKLYNYKINVDSELGIEIDNNWNRVATKERALLDALYLKIFSKNYPWDSEIYIKNVDQKLMGQLLEIYPERVKNYYLKLYNESRTRITS